GLAGPAGEAGAVVGDVQPRAHEGRVLVRVLLRLRASGRLGLTHGPQSTTPGRYGARVQQTPPTLAVDCGGGGIKASVLDAAGTMHAQPVRAATPYPLPPQRLVTLIGDLAGKLPEAGRVTAGVPGRIRAGSAGAGADRGRGARDGRGRGRVSGAAALRRHAAGQCALRRRCAAS